MKRAIFGILIICFSLLLKSCNTTEPPLPNGEKPTLELKLEDVSCTEAWIELTTTNLQLPAELILKQSAAGDSVSQIFILNTQDSLLYIDSLLPNRNYQYQVSSIQNPVSSNELSVTTMDTTSHNFTFETFTFGGSAGSSTLYDVAIINENNIWAVGEILIADTSINGYTTYNAVHWDGNDWELKRINMLSSCNPVAYPPLKAIWAFSENNIIVTSGGSIGRFDGLTNIPDCSIRPLLTGSINKIWGSSSSDLYVVGNNGNIASYNGTIWQRLESGTDISMSDVYGNNSNEIFISGADNVNVKGIILKKSGSNGVSTLITSEIITENQLFDKLFGSLSSVWLDEKNTLYTGGNILFCYRFNRWDYVRSMPENYIGGNPNVYYRGFIHSIQGNASNDYFVVGDRNTVRHFNGVTWQQIGFPYDPNSYRIWRSVCVKDNVCIIVGDNVNNASIMIIRK